MTNHIGITSKTSILYHKSTDRKWSVVLSIKPNITPDCEVRNETWDNINEIHSFSLGITKGDNVDDDDCNDNIEDNELYVREDHFKEILVEKSSRKQKI